MESTNQAQQQSINYLESLMNASFVAKPLGTQRTTLLTSRRGAMVGEKLIVRSPAIDHELIEKALRDGIGCHSGQTSRQHSTLATEEDEDCSSSSSSDEMFDDDGDAQMKN